MKNNMSPDPEGGRHNLYASAKFPNVHQEHVNVVKQVCHVLLHLDVKKTMNFVKTL